MRDPTVPLIYEENVVYLGMAGCGPSKLICQRRYENLEMYCKPEVSKYDPLKKDS